MQIAIDRAATDDDLRRITALAGVIWRACFPGVITPEQIEYMLAWMYSPAQLRQDVAAGVTYELLVVDGQRVGFVAYGPGDASDAVKLHKLYVLPAYHGQGHGQLLLRHVEQQARARQAARVYLTVNKQNQRAIAAYERAGWQRAAAVVTDIGGGFVMDDYVYERRLV